VNTYNPLAQEQLRQIAGSVGALTYQRELVGESVLRGRVTTQAMVLSFANEFRWVVAALAVGVVLVLVLKKPGAAGEAAGAH
jgi:hypothetical protein